MSNGKRRADPAVVGHIIHLTHRMTPNEPLSTTALIAWARQALRMSPQELGITLQVGARTVRRWEAGTTLPSRRYRARLEQLGDLRELLDAVFESPAAAEAWLEASMPGLRGRSPQAIIRQGDVEGIVEVLATMESGVFT